MVGRTILGQRENDAIERIQAYAERKKEADNEKVAEALERVKSVRGPDENHIRVFRLQAIADLLEATDDEAGVALKEQTVPELRELANEKGVEGAVSQMNKGELIDAIKAKDEEEDQ